LIAKASGNVDPGFAVIAPNSEGEETISPQGETAMSEFVRICSQSELPPAGEVREFNAAGRAFCVANVGGTICVLNAECPHEGGPLGEGTIEDGRVVCPWHSYAFDPQTGESAQDPEVKAEVFAATVENGELRAKV
jgi:nitrite reductase/ring-hydroxylating ferredoxin subunit